MESNDVEYRTQREETVSKMRAQLPEYIVNCLVASGFDSSIALGTLNLSEKPTNSLEDERFFRMARSMTPTFSTVINFSLLGLTKRINRLNMLSKLESESEVTGIVYPRLLSHIKKHGHNSATIRQVSMLDSEIAEVVEESKCLAQQTMESLGMADLLKKKKCWDYPPIPKLDKLILDEKKDDDNDEKIDQSGKIDSMREVITEEEADQIAKGIVQLKDAGIISNDLNTELQQLHRSVFKQGSALPIYSTTQTETQSPSGKVCKRKLSPSFVPIIHNGDEKYIHKVTLVWLFQEGERVSSDRLFRVRKTQPHSNDPDAQKTTPTDKIVQQEPIVSSTLQIGDLCIFLDTRTPKRWNFGRVIKFAYYKEKFYLNKKISAICLKHC